MRYRAEIDYDTISAYALEECASAKVRPSTWTGSPAIALRHARAMAAVIRAAKAWQRASARFERSCEADALVSTVAPILQAQLDAEKRLLAATARLVAVEKEVSR